MKILSTRADKMSAKMMHVVLATVVAAVMMTPEVAASAGTIGRRLKSEGSEGGFNGPVGTASTGIGRSCVCI